MIGMRMGDDEGIDRFWCQQLGLGKCIPSGLLRMKPCIDEDTVRTKLVVEGISADLSGATKCEKLKVVQLLLSFIDIA